MGILGVIFGLLMPRNLHVQNFSLTGPLDQKFKMADFGSNKAFCPNFYIAISKEPLGFRSRYFQSSHISMIPTNGAKMKKNVRGKGVKFYKKLDDLIWNCPIKNTACMIKIFKTI